ncbi:MAG: cell division protein FtsI, partial [Clostridiales bacterium]|nr:cell division protein FtsI [Clostridiales bacterium]
TGYLTVGDYDIHCVNTLGHGVLTVSQALEKSCNVALMDIGLTIGKDIFMTYNKNFNFGLKTNIDLAGEARTDSLVFNADKMVPTDLAIASFGQGYNVTMIQTAAAFSSVINGGYYYEPHVVNKILSTDGAVVENIEPRLLKQTISAETSEKMVGYLNNVVSLGTGSKARPAGYTMGGKTGTAETYPRNTEHYVVSFMGYVPADDPQVLIYVVVDEPNTEDQAHSTYAMGLVRNIMTEVLPYLNIFMTEELTEEEKVELSALGLYEAQPVAEDATGAEEEIPAGTEGTQTPETEGEAAPNTGEEGTTESTQEEEGETTVSDPSDFMEIDPETGYYINPTTGEMIDPETGFVVDPTQSSLGGL